MIRPVLSGCVAYVLFISIGCDSHPVPGSNSDTTLVKGTYAYDADFLKKHTHLLVELQSEDGNGKILLSADFQGRVMTSTATGDSGTSFGWINYSLIGSGEKKRQFNPVGGEERFWLGPEGGQYSIYFKRGDSFNISHWQVPALIDTLPFKIQDSSKTQVVFTKKASLTNYSGSVFDIGIERKIVALGKKRLEEKLSLPIPNGLHYVAYESTNRIENTGPTDWSKDKGLLSIWLLSMLTPTSETMVIIPFTPSKKARSYITDNYFGLFPPERLTIKDSVLFFVCDGKYRSKIGLSPIIAKNRAASFDFKNNVLTVLLFEVEKNGSYVNSKWELQHEPYKGDVINSYNDGPLSDGTQLGPFYEIESSSAASELKKGENQEYHQTICHFQGPYEDLRSLSLKILGVDLNEIKR